MDKTKLKQIVDTIFETVEGFLPLTLRMLVHMLHIFVVTNLLDKLAARKAGPMAAPEQLKEFINDMLSQLTGLLGTRPLLAKLLTAFTKYVTGPIIDLIWDKLVGTGLVTPDGPTVNVVGAKPRDGLVIRRSTDEFIKAVSE